MKVIEPAVWETVSNVWRADQKQTREILEVEAEDVGKKVDHYQGYNHRTVTLRSLDVGQRIIRWADDTGWTCWVFEGPAP